MGSHNHSSSISCELRIIRAQNPKKSAGESLFVRCYLSAGNKNRIRLDTRKITSNSNMVWNQTFSLDFLATEESIKQFEQGSVVFELRSRNNTPLIGKLSGSKLLGRAEIPWKNVFETTEMQIEKWVVMKNKSVHNDFKLPAVQIGMKIQEASEAIKRNKYQERMSDFSCKDCDQNNYYLDYDFYALGFGLELEAGL